QMFTFRCFPCSITWNFSYSQQFSLFLPAVIFDDCSGHQRTLFSTEDTRFKVAPDGTVSLKRPVKLHNRHRNFFVYAWNSEGKKFSARVVMQPELGTNDPPSEVDSASYPVSTEPVPVLEFPQSSHGLKRRKRDWIIPPINFPENDKGPYPKEIRTSNDKEAKIHYSITGPGADEPPKGLFFMDKYSGQIFVTQPLDREKQAHYTLFAHASASGGTPVEAPMEIIINVIDMNDNKPVFTEDTYEGSIPEATQVGYDILIVTATDADDPNTENGEIAYSILSQDPKEPNGNMFAINPNSGQIRLNSPGLDKEQYPQYTLTVQAADQAGKGFPTTCTVLIKVTDSNDNAPQFVESKYTASVPENKVDAEVVRMQVTDEDEPHTPAWHAKFRIREGDPGGFFNVTTGPSGQEGIITTAKALDYEKRNQYTLLVTVENDVPFAIKLPTSTATVVVNVEDVNEAPIFIPSELGVKAAEDAKVGERLATYTATDPDTQMKQSIEYRMAPDSTGWLSINKTTGAITVKSPMDRESTDVVDGKYKALVLAVDNAVVPATGTGTLQVILEDVNDNAPTIDEREIKICNQDPEPVLLSVSDKDGPPFGAPFSVQLFEQSLTNWTATMNETRTGIILKLKTRLPQDKYNVMLTVSDNKNFGQVNTILAFVCDCKGKDVECGDKLVAGMELPGILGILAAVLLLLLLLLLLLMFVRRRSKVKKEPLLQDDDVRDNIYYYDEEGGGEEDQDYDLSQLHRGLDNRPEVFRNDVAPTFMSAPQYRPRPANPEDIGNFIDDNLKAADNDPTAPPYDSLLVFDYEGGGSEAGSLSSLNSSSSGGEQDYDFLNEWGPRFKKLADMYGGSDD
uniref:Cadherin-1 n=1 Tax=Scleropages formosus TaxID=113540 RepID=A0A8C9WLR1_SCLFO